mgnify:CR=1 FL=1
MGTSSYPIISLSAYVPVPAAVGGRIYGEKRSNFKWKRFKGVIKWKTDNNKKEI